MRVHFIQQDEWVEPGEYLAWAERHGCEVSFTKCWQFEPVPETVDADFLIVLGGWQCPATTKAECGYFDAEAEKRLIRRCVESGKVVVGACLGAQLLGDAMGANFAHSPEREVGPVKARLTAAGRADPLFAAFPDTFLAGAWHNDMPGLTEDSVVIAESDGCPRQIIRYGELAYGFQAHMEFTPRIVAAGVRESGESLKRGGKYVQTAEELLAFDYTGMNAMLSDFLDRLAEKYRRMCAESA